MGWDSSWIGIRIRTWLWKFRRRCQTQSEIPPIVIEIPPQAPPPTGSTELELERERILNLHHYDPTTTPKDIWYNPQPPDPEIPMEFSIAESGFKCLICKAKVNTKDSIIECCKCRTPFHEECIRYIEKCGVFGCGSVAFMKRAPLVPPDPIALQCEFYENKL